MATHLKSWGLFDSVTSENTSYGRYTQQDQEDNGRQGVLCRHANPVERPSRQVESFGQSQNFYDTVKNSLY